MNWVSFSGRASSNGVIVRAIPAQAFHLQIGQRYYSGIGQTRPVDVINNPLVNSDMVDFVFGRER
jgi:hypothetical protein